MTRLDWMISVLHENRIGCPENALSQMLQRSLRKLIPSSHQHFMELG
jgi:hypothetical protein